MDPDERAALIYAKHAAAGADINWRNGAVTYPKPQG